MAPTGKNSLQRQDYFVQFGTGRFYCRSLSDMKQCKVSGLESKFVLNSDSPDADILLLTFPGSGWLRPEHTDPLFE